MSEQHIKEQVRHYLGLSEHLDSYWDVVDTYPKTGEAQLALAHYNDNFNHDSRSQQPLRQVRGIIVDLNTGAVVANSLGYTQSLPCYEPLEFTKSPGEPDGKISFQTEISTYLNSESSAPNETAKISIGQQEFSSKNTQLFLGYEGALIRVFKWNGEVLFSTHRKIDAYSSSWGGRVPFYEIYKELGGPDPESLFGEEDYSPYCHMFLIVDYRIRLATSIRDNRIIYLGVQKVWDETKYASVEMTGNSDQVEMSSSEVKNVAGSASQYVHEADKSRSKAGPYFYYKEFPLIIPEFGTEPEAFAPELNRAFIEQPEIDVTIANKFMFPGKFATNPPEDAQRSIRENEMIISYSPDAKTVSDIFFQKPAVEATDERLSGGDFVMLYHQTPSGETLIYRLEPAAYVYRSQITKNDPNLYHQFVIEMVNFTKANPQELVSEYPKFLGGDGLPLKLDTPNNRQVYWWSIYYDAISPDYKPEVDDFYNNYLSDVKMVANFILHDFPKIRDEEELKRINENTQRRLVDIRERSRGVADKSNGSPFGVITGFLYRETGPSFYKMISSIKNLKKYRESPKE